ncbi:MAG: hypothetical protein ACKOWR_05635 [Micrococcales bacterium]
MTFFAFDELVVVLVDEVVFAVDADAQITSEPPEILEPTFRLPANEDDVQAA